MIDRFMLTPFFMDQPRAGFADLVTAGWVVNQPALPALPTVQARMGALYEPLAAFTAAAIAAGNRPVSFAGDCCAAIGTLAGLQRAGLEPTLIWFDAHGDFNDWATTPSGFLGGMPLAMLTGRGEQTIVDAVGLQPLADARVILTDARDLDLGERILLAESGVQVVPDTADLLTMPLPAGPLYVHFDTDIINAAAAPAMSYLAAGGPSVDLLARVFSRLAGSGQIAALSVSAWNPALDGADLTRDNVLTLLHALLGQSDIASDPNNPL